MATFYVDYEGGNDVNDGLSFANRKKTIPSANTAASAGDTIRVMASTAPTSIGSATWTNLSKTVTLPSALTKNISLCESAWTAALNVTTSTSTTRKEGSNSTSIAIAAAFTTGQAAREVITATDFSAYKQVSFWIRTNLAIAASTLELRLCSDTLGLVTVNTIPIPAIPNVNLWTAITYDNGAALGASIQSIVLQATADPGTVTILLDNILACKDSTSADAITLNSLIGKNTTGETWFAIQSINGATILLDAHTESLATQGRGYYGTSESVTTYKQEPILTNLSTATSAFVMTKSGNPGSPITISGGWDRTAMTTQSGITHFSGRNGSIEGIRTAVFNYLNFDTIYLYRYTTGWQMNGSAYINITNSHSNNHSSFGIITTSEMCSVTDFYSSSTGSTGISMSGHTHTFTNLTCNNHQSQGYQNSIGNNNYYKNVSCNNNASRAVYINTSFGVVIENLTTSNNALESVRSDASNAVLINASIAEATKFNCSTPPFSGAPLKVHGYDGDSNDNRVVWDVGTIQSVADSNRHTASGLAWKFSPSSTGATASYPLALKETIRVACAASALVTISVWVKRSNTGITARLFVKGGQIAGVPSDVSASASGAANVYEQISVTFTPTVAGVVNVELQAYGGTTYNAWFDDMTITQA